MKTTIQAELVKIAYYVSCFTYCCILSNMWMTLSSFSLKHNVFLFSTCRQCTCFAFATKSRYVVGVDNVTTSRKSRAHNCNSHALQTCMNKMSCSKLPRTLVYAPVRIWKVDHCYEPWTTSEGGRSGHCTGPQRIVCLHKVIHFCMYSLRTFMNHT